MTEKSLPADWKEKVTKYLESRRPAKPVSAAGEFIIFATKENANRLLETDEIARAARYLWGVTATRPEVQQELHKFIGDALNSLSQATSSKYRRAKRSRKAWGEIAEALEIVRDDGLFFRDYHPSLSPPGLLERFNRDIYPLASQKIDPKMKKFLKDIERKNKDFEEKIKYASSVGHDTLDKAISYYRNRAEDAITKTRPKDPGPSDTLFNLVGLCRTWGFEGRVRNQVVMLFINAGAKAFPSAFARINKRTISVRASEMKKNPWNWRE